MLAPRKKLWSTPDAVVERAILELRLTNEDILFDVGAGDGRFLIQSALTSPVRKCVGIEIDEERAQEALKNIADRGLSDRCNIICGNALEQDLSQATAFFLYLIPRGLRILLPQLHAIGRPVRVVTYMSPFPDSEVPEQVIHVSSPKHPGAEWPIYVYTVNK